MILVKCQFYLPLNPLLFGLYYSLVPEYLSFFCMCSLMASKLDMEAYKGMPVVETPRLLKVEHAVVEYDDVRI